jgi:hypothetical protein
MTDFQTLIRLELAGDPPPSRDVVAGALRAGRRGRTRRRWVFASGAAAIIAIAAVALSSLVPWQAWRLSAQAGSVRVVPASGPLVPATPAAALVALRYLLPPGLSGPYLGRWEGNRQFWVVTETTDRGTGGEVRLTVSHIEGAYAAAGDGCRGLAVPASSCVRTVLADRTVVTVAHVDRYCVGAMFVTVVRPSDTAVSLSVQGCLRSSVPARPLLTDAEGVAIAANPVFAWQMPASLVDSGAQSFPDLPEAPQ